MTIVNKYRIYCSTENSSKYVWSEDTPTTCPSNESHSLDETKTTIVDFEGDEAPHLTDGKPLYAPNRFSTGILTSRTSCGDDIENGVRFGGDRFEFNVTTSGEHTFDLQFMEPVEIAGGQFFAWEGAEQDDHLSFEVHADATSAEYTTTSGNMSKYEIAPGANMFIPTVSGDWTIDLEETLNDNVSFTKAVPIPNPYTTGFFDYNALTNVLSVNASQLGKFDLYDFPVRLAQFMTKVFILPEQNMVCNDTAVKPFQCVPHWIYKAILFNNRDKTLRLSCKLYLGRYDIS